MTKRSGSIALVLLLLCAGCAARVASKSEAAVPATTPAPKAAPQKPPSRPAVPDVPVAGTPSGNPRSEPASPVGNSPAPVPKGAENQPPPATESTYVFSPQQAVSASGGPSPLPSSTPTRSSPPPPKDAAEKGPPGELQLVVVASAPEVATGSIATVDVMASSSSAIVDAPIHLTFDPTVVEFVDGVPGDFLTQGGSSVVFLADGSSRPGDVAVAAGRVERHEGASGSGLLCRVRLRGLRAGTTPVLVGRAKAWSSHGQELNVVSAGTTLVVR